jgi:hypothetical protein
MKTIGVAGPELAPLSGGQRRKKPLRAEGRRKHAGSAKPFADLEVSVISPNCEVERSG